MNSFTEPYEPMNPMDYDERDPRDSEETTAGRVRQSVEGERCPNPEDLRNELYTVVGQTADPRQLLDWCRRFADDMIHWYAAAQERAKEAEAYDDQIQAANRRLAEANGELTRRYFEMWRILERVDTLCRESADSGMTARQLGSEIVGMIDEALAQLPGGGGE